MRVLLVNSSSGLGGAETHVAQLSRGLVARGHDVHVASPAEGPLVAAVIDGGGSHHPAPMYPDRPSSAQVSRLRAIVRDVDPDTVHLHGIRAGLLGRIALLPERLAHSGHSGKPPTRGPAIVYTVHGAHHLHYSPPWDRVYARVERLLETLATDATIFVCRADLVDCIATRASSGNPCYVVYNGIDMADRHNEPVAGATRRAVRAAFGLPEDATILLAVGRLSRQKDYPTLLRAVAAARDEIEAAGAAILIVGEGTQREHLLHLATDLGLNPPFVQFLGARSDVPHLMEASDLLVLSSAWEGLPYVALEAMVAGLPIIATRVGGMPEVVDHGVSGLLVPPGDPRSLAKALVTTLRDPALRTSLGRASRKRLGRVFDEQTTVLETEAVYRQAVAWAEQADRR